MPADDESFLPVYSGFVHQVKINHHKEMLDNVERSITRLKESRFPRLWSLLMNPFLGWPSQSVDEHLAELYWQKRRRELKIEELEKELQTGVSPS